LDNWYNGFRSVLLYPIYTLVFHLAIEGIIETSIITAETKKANWIELRNLAIVGIDIRIVVP